ncbi:MAG: hypothetical protein A2V64_11795 [Bacteroidetes bacterium RBG_13_43_22]|nr:MAG: hypothetical protein A2V64_11795 [Bacteroidetes bacterium RBG_13_43_22]
MITLFIFKSHARGMQYGLGTYLKELTESLLKLHDIVLFVVAYHNQNYKEFSIKEVSPRYKEVFIPSPVFRVSQNNTFDFRVSQNNTFDKKYASVVVKLLSGLIPVKGKVIFQMNYIDDLPIVIELKKYYKYPVISVVQFAMWQQLFEGNRKKITGLNIDKPSDNIEYTFFRERELYRLSDHIVSVTAYMKEFLIKEYGINQDNITIIQNGIKNGYKPVSKLQKDEIRRKLGFSENEIILLFSGRIDFCKGVFHLIEAFEEACKYKDNLRLVLMGQGDIQECFKRTQAFFGKVTYTGFIQKDMVSLFYRIADIGVVPSVYDHCPLTILEMMANRIPLIVSRINGPDEMLNDDQCLFVDPVINESGDISLKTKELSDAIITLSENVKFRKELAKNAYNLLEKRFTASRMAEDMNRLFSSLIKTM